MMSGASAIVRLALPRGAAAPTLSKASPLSLSHLFDTKCNLLTNINDSMSSRRPISFVATKVMTGPWSHPTIYRQQQQQKIQHDQIRWFSSSDTGKDDELTPSTTITTTDENNSEPASISGSDQHDAWVQFQRSIVVSGFNTGQTVREKKLGKKNRGGKMDRKRKEREAELEAAMRGEDITQLKGGEFPALRYSDEETERLLAEAYAAIPPRAGKRGTLNLKRQHRRWFIKRQYDYKKKRERIATHERRMAKRKTINEAITKIRREAMDVRGGDKDYQNDVLQRWAMMCGHGENEVAVSEGVACMK